MKKEEKVWSSNLTSFGRQLQATLTFYRNLHVVDILFIVQISDTKEKGAREDYLLLVV